MKTQALEVLSPREIYGKSSDCVILAKPIGLGHWYVYIFNNVVNGTKVVEKLEVSCDSIYSPCYREIHRCVSSEDISCMNELFIKLQKNENYMYFGKFTKDICGGYHKQL